MPQVARRVSARRLPLFISRARRRFRRHATIVDAAAMPIGHAYYDTAEAARAIAERRHA